MNTLYSIIGLFALGAILGMYLLTFVMRNKETPKAVALIHGLFVAIALIMLINYSVKNGPGLTESIVLFVIAALGGFYLFYRDINAKPIPKWLAIVHGLAAVAGFGFLLVFAFVK